MELTRSSIKPVGYVMIVNEELMVRVFPPKGPPNSCSKRLSFLHYFSPTEIHRYSGKNEKFLKVGNGLIFDGNPHTIEYDPDRRYFPAERIRKEKWFVKRRKQLESVGLRPVLNYII